MELGLIGTLVGVGGTLVVSVLGLLERVKNSRLESRVGGLQAELARTSVIAIQLQDRLHRTEEVVSGLQKNEKLLLAELERSGAAPGDLLNRLYQSGSDSKA